MDCPGSGPGPLKPWLRSLAGTFALWCFGGWCGLKLNASPTYSLARVILISRRVEKNRLRAASSTDLFADTNVAADQLEQTRAHETQILARGLQTLNASIDTLSRRMDIVEEQQAAKAKADAEREQRRIQDYLDSLPSPDEPATRQPSGEMHTLPATEDDQGALPNELREGTPPETGNNPEPDPLELAYPQRPKYQQMPAISLASEDDY